MSTQSICLEMRYKSRIPVMIMYTFVYVTKCYLAQFFPYKSVIIPTLAVRRLSTLSKFLFRSSGSIGLMSPPLTSDRSVTSHACFFSLLRDKFRSSLDYKMSVADLEEAVSDWENQVRSHAGFP